MNELSNNADQNKLITKTDSEILSAQYNEPEFIVPNLISVGLTLLTGKPKSGKSLMAMDLSISLASGSSFLGKFDVAAQKVPLFALADRDVRRRFFM